SRGNSSSMWQVEDARPEHDSQIRELFKSAFREDMSRAQWQWKYDEGRGVGVVVSRESEIIAYFGGTERRVLFKGEAVCAIQCGDSMVGESHRGTLSKKGPFYLSVTTFLDKYVGFNRPYLLSYGFPNARAMRLAEHLGMYAEVGNLVDVVWSAESSSAFSSVEFDFASGDHQRTLEELWVNMAAEFTDRTIGVRDLAYLRHRYHDHPELRYQLHLVHRKSDGKLLGLIVTRQVKDRLLLLDVVAPTNMIRELAGFGRHLASELDCRELYGWLTEIDCHLVADSSLQIGETPLRLPLGVYCEGLQAAEVKDTWFFMCGDSDFL
ncbi:MAG: GNAT family N-acetyltransferase, partial [Gammaproteobacteria bacterium]|nr:GNAT family N-acetyltransferase [Gammaproteobacteria bacterium]